MRCECKDIKKNIKNEGVKIRKRLSKDEMVQRRDSADYRANTASSCSDLAPFPMHWDSVAMLPLPESRWYKSGKESLAYCGCRDSSHLQSKTPVTDGARARFAPARFTKIKKNPAKVYRSRAASTERTERQLNV